MILRVFGYLRPRGCEKSPYSLSEDYYLSYKFLWIFFIFSTVVAFVGVVLWMSSENCSQCTGQRTSLNRTALVSNQSLQPLTKSLIFISVLDIGSNTSRLALNDGGFFKLYHSNRIDCLNVQILM